MKTAWSGQQVMIKVHLVASAFCLPMVLLVAISGGLYLLGHKGQFTVTEVDLPAGASLGTDSATLEDDVRQFLADHDIDHRFEYLKVSGNTLTTRPTSRVNYVLVVEETGVAMTRNEPNLQKVLIELHKGHGSIVFKNFQKVVAAALLFILVSGVALGFASSNLRLLTVVVSVAGLLVFIVFGFAI